MSQDDNIADQTVMDTLDENPKQGYAAKKAEEQALKRKKLKKYAVIGIGVSLLSYIVYWGFKPFKAPEYFSYCRTFLELNIPYPDTLYVSEVIPTRDGSMLLWYTHTDAFGEYRLENIRCSFTHDTETQRVLMGHIKMGKVDISEARINSFNHAVPYFEQNEIVFDYPRPLPDSLSGLFFDFGSVRRITIDPVKR